MDTRIDVGPTMGIAAVKSGDAAALKAWLAAGGAPDVRETDGWTPLLWAAARGRADMVALLLAHGARPDIAHGRSGALPIHMAGHSGDVATGKLLLNIAPNHLDAVWDLNGHTVLLQAVFYGHRDLARFLVDRGADTAITTARGLGPVEFARQFEDQGMVAILAPHDSPAAKKAAYYAGYLAHIAPEVPPAEEGAQALADRLAAVIQLGLTTAGSDTGSTPATLAAVRALIEGEGADVNRLAGPLGQPALIVTVTGNNGQPPSPAVAGLRLDLARLLLDHGADPTRHERHPMGAQTVIRAAVFNHLDILKACGRMVSPGALADAINEVPVVNGLTALHDTVLRATMAAPKHVDGYVEQARWFMEQGGRSDIEDFAGTTQRAIAARCNRPDVRAQLLEVLGTVTEPLPN